MHITTPQENDNIISRENLNGTLCPVEFYHGTIYKFDKFKRVPRKIHIPKILPESPDWTDIIDLGVHFSVSHKTAENAMFQHTTGRLCFEKGYMGKKYQSIREKEAEETVKLQGVVKRVLLRGNWAWINVDAGGWQMPQLVSGIILENNFNIPNINKNNSLNNFKMVNTLQSLTQYKTFLSNGVGFETLCFNLCKATSEILSLDIGQPKEDTDLCFKAMSINPPKFNNILRNFFIESGVQILLYPNKYEGENGELDISAIALTHDSILCPDTHEVLGDVNF